MGVHRADPGSARHVGRYLSRRSFLGSPCWILPSVLRIHTELYAALAKKGQLIGAHDLIIAATARWHNLSLLTDNVNEFSRVPGLRVIPFTS